MDNDARSLPASPSNDGPSNMYSPQPQSTLLSLPCEIRLEIYKHLLVISTSHPRGRTSTRLSSTAKKNRSDNDNDDTRRSHDEEERRRAARARAPLHPQILSACRQSHAEAEPILYTHNTFTAHPSLLASLPSLPPVQRQVTHARVARLIRRWRVAVRLDADPQFSARAVAAAFAGCDSLEVDCWQAMYGAADPGVVLGRFADLRGVKSCVVRGSIGSEWIAAMEQSIMAQSGAGDEGEVERATEAGDDEEPEWGAGKQEMFGGGTKYDLWRHGNR